LGQETIEQPSFFYMC